MKFAERLDADRIPEFAEKYINYRGLKYVLSRIKVSHNTGHILSPAWACSVLGSPCRLQSSQSVGRRAWGAGGCSSCPRDPSTL